jgi:hypothetical protein
MTTGNRTAGVQPDLTKNFSLRIYEENLFSPVFLLTTRSKNRFLEA